MTAREAFLDELTQRTTSHLRALAAESAEAFSRYSGWPDGAAVYDALQYRFAMDGAQEIGALLIDLVSGARDNGAVMVTERDFLGLQFVAEEFGERIPPASAHALKELLTVLEKAGPSR